MKLTPSFLSSLVPNIHQIKEIDCRNKEINHIDDISVAVELRKIDLSNNSLSNGSLSGLKHCTSLTWINLSHNKLESFEGLELLDQLTGRRIVIHPSSLKCNKQRNQ